MKKQENKSRYALLGALTIKPMSGYDIKKFIEKSMSYFWNENYAWIYPTLKNLEQEGFVASIQEKQEGRPERRCYTLTEQGRNELRIWLSKPTEFHQLERNEHLLKLFFADQVSPATIKEQIRRWSEELRAMLVTLEDFEHQASMASLQQEVPPGRPYRLMALDYGLSLVRAQLGWCEETIARLEPLDLNSSEKEMSC